MFTRSSLSVYLLSLCILLWFAAMPARAWTPSIVPSITFKPSTTATRFLNKDERPQDDEESDGDDFFFIRKSLMGDMGRASQILADGFYKGRTNFITYQWERLETYLSLESSFPKPQTRHELFVACAAQSGKVLGLAEVDARRDDDDSSGNNNNNNNSRGQNGPYLCNLAVDPSFSRRGIASALVKQCESQVREWYHSSSTDDDDDDSDRISPSLHLKVRESNTAALQMYDKLGYHCYLQEKEKKTGETVIAMRKEL